MLETAIFLYDFPWNTSYTLARSRSICDLEKIPEGEESLHITAKISVKRSCVTWVFFTHTSLWYFALFHLARWCDMKSVDVFPDRTWYEAATVHRSCACTCKFHGACKTSSHQDKTYFSLPELQLYKTTFGFPFQSRMLLGWVPMPCTEPSGQWEFCKWFLVTEVC